MSRKIVGVTVGTPLGISAIKEKLNPVTSVNGVEADKNGNVEITIPDSGGNVDLTGYATEQYVKDYAQPKGNYLTEVPTGYATEEFVKNKIAEAELGGEEVDMSGYAQKSELPTKVSQLQNDSGYLTEHQDISGKLDVSALPTAINTALAQAKASGEFDGKDGVDGKNGSDGYTPVKDKDYFDGKDGQDGNPGKDGSNGVSATHSWNGTVLTITSASGISSADLKGDKGETGADGVFVRNLLDNSDFRNPVNQRGATSYKGNGYGIDRWRLWHNNGYAGWMVSVEDGCIRVSDNPDSTSTSVNWFRQDVEVDAGLRGKTVTFAAKVKGNSNVRLNINNSAIGSYLEMDDWYVMAQTYTIPDDATTIYVALQSRNPTEDGYLCEWVALYEGEYTVETLPEYQPKGYGVELAECQRYYQIINNGVGSVRTNEDKILVTLPLCVSMRNAISVASAKIATVRASGLRIDNPEFEITAVAYNNYNSACVIELGGTFTGMANGIAYIDGRFHLSADIL